MLSNFKFIGEEIALDIKDTEKLKRMRHTFELNYRITRLYAQYLEYYPELITEEMVKEITEGSDIREEEALTALLSEVFQLDDSAGGDERRLIRDYLSPSIRVLDTEKYENDPYYKNIKIEDLKDGNWEFKWESYKPYRAVIVGDMVSRGDFSEYPPLGFFRREFKFPAILEYGNEWMTLTPVDLDTSVEAIAAAHGSVVTFGLGLGYYAYMASEKAEVSELYIIEKSEKVIELFKKHILPQFPHKEKIKIICADALEYAEKEMPKKNFDLAFVDTWRDASDGAPMYQKMKALEKLSHRTKFMYWIEGFLTSRLRSLKFEELWEKYESRDKSAPKSYAEFAAELEKI